MKTNTTFVSVSENKPPHSLHSDADSSESVTYSLIIKHVIVYRASNRAKNSQLIPSTCGVATAKLLYGLTPNDILDHILRPLSCLLFGPQPAPQNDKQAMS